MRSFFVLFLVVGLSACGGGSSSSGGSSPPPPVPTTVSDVSAVALNERSVALSWTDNATNETGYVIERSLNKGDGLVVITELAADAVAFVDTGLNADTLYYYQVKAVNRRGRGEAVLTLSTTAVTGAPNTPTQFEIVAESQSSIHFSWQDNADDETGYTLNYVTVGGPQLGQAGTINLPANTTSHAMSSLAAGRVYTFELVANRDALSSPAVRASVTTPAPPAGAPAAPKQPDCKGIGCQSHSH